MEIVYAARGQGGCVECARFLRPVRAVPWATRRRPVRSRDARAIPLGAPVFLATTWPLSARPLERLVLAQDTGGAIRGALRADFFWGFGDGAGREAGRMKQEGRMWILWPKDAGAPKLADPSRPN
jgi:hypothetical protein